MSSTVFTTLASGCLMTYIKDGPFLPLYQPARSTTLTVLSVTLDTSPQLDGRTFCCSRGATMMSL